MIIKEKYCCTFCHAEYDTFEECEACEDSHAYPTTIEARDYIPHRKYPRYLSVMTEDGAVAKYAFKEELRGPLNV